jgi:hypothetical protein
MADTEVNAPPRLRGSMDSGTVLRSSGWDATRCDMQAWLERTGQGTLRHTHYGRKWDDEGPHPALLGDPLVRQIYLIDIAFFIAAERVSYLASAGLLRLAPDEASQIYIASQVMDEARHYEVFCKKFADFGYTPDQRDRIVGNYVTPAMRDFHDLILEQVDRGDFVSATIAQNIIMEGMAYPIYRYEYKYWSKFDPSLSSIIRGAFADEAHHVGYGEAMISHIYAGMDGANKARIATLLSRFEKLMTEIFEGVIRHYVGMYQECSNEHDALVGGIEIFKGHRLRDVTEEMQVRVLLQEIRDEHAQRLARMGIAA